VWRTFSDPSKIKPALYLKKTDDKYGPLGKTKREERRQTDWGFWGTVQAGGQNKERGDVFQGRTKKRGRELERGVVVGGGQIPEETGGKPTNINNQSQRRRQKNHVLKEGLRPGGTKWGQKLAWGKRGKRGVCVQGGKGKEMSGHALGGKKNKRTIREATGRGQGRKL